MNAIAYDDDFQTDPKRVFPRHEDIHFPVATRKLAMLHGPQIDVLTSHKAVMRRDAWGSAQCLGVVGMDYKVVPHADHFDMVEKALISSLQLNDLKGCYVTDKVSNGGAWARRDYIFPGVTATLDTPGIRDKLGYACFAWNSYDGSSSVAALLGTLTMYCTNGQFSMEYDARKFRKHTAGLRLEQFRKMLEGGVGRFYRDAERYQRWVDLQVKDDTVEALFKMRFSKTRARHLQTQYEEEVTTRGRNVWAVWNTLTAYASHSSDLFKVRDRGQDTLDRTLTGRQSAVHHLVKSDVWNDFVQLAVAA